jgi:hypothetical protein
MGRKGFLMFKIVSLILFSRVLAPLGQAQGTRCKVYGITDSPQRLTCQFPAETLRLSCRAGEYFIDEEKVFVAFHYEVESGPVPLVFKTDTRTLVVTMHSSRNIRAELESKNPVNGRCQL